jgi:ribosomal-protein-alanine N-acetyltransferase
MNDMLQIRPMQAADLEQVIAIDQTSFSLPWPKSAFLFELKENPLSMLWVAEMLQSDGSKIIVGMIVIWLILDEVHIATIAVEPTYRRQGIALELLAIALEHAIQKGMTQATLEVRAGNHAAQGVYNRFGFKIVGQRPHYYQDNGEDAIIMTASNLNKPYLSWLQSKGWKEIRTAACN